MELFNQQNILGQYYIYQLYCLYAQQYPGLNFQSAYQSNPYLMNQFYQSVLPQSQPRFNPYQQLLSLYGQAIPYQQMPQINIGNTIHQVNYNLDRGGPEQQLPTKQIPIQQGEEKPVEVISPKKTTTKLKIPLSPKQSKDNKEVKDKGFLSKKRERERDKNKNKHKETDDMPMKPLPPKDSSTPSKVVVGETIATTMPAINKEDESNVDVEEVPENNNIIIINSDNNIESNTKENNISNVATITSFNFSPKEAIESKGVLTRTSLIAAKKNDKKPFEQNYYQNFEHYLNDPFFDIVNNKKNTKKNRESNYVKTSSPEVFMDLNFFRKCREKHKTLHIVPCHFIPQLKFRHIHKSEDDANQICLIWKLADFEMLNPGNNINEVINLLQSKWPIDSLKYWEDHCLYFFALCGYNVDITVKELEEYRTRTAFRIYAFKINRENGNEK